LATSLSRRCGPKCRGCSCMFRSRMMWKNILASPPRRPAAAAAGSERVPSPSREGASG
jgi:hypothetical protein